MSPKKSPKKKSAGPKSKKPVTKSSPEKSPSPSKRTSKNDLSDKDEETLKRQIEAIKQEIDIEKRKGKSIKSKQSVIEKEIELFKEVDLPKVNKELDASETAVKKHEK